MEINIFKEGGVTFPVFGLKKRDFKLLLTRICRNLRLNNSSITLILVDNEYIKKINKEYRKKNKATDVISFAYRDSIFPSIDLKNDILGDIYISLEKASQQAKDYNVQLEDEVKRLLVHGVLHLIGYDHEQSDKDAQRMFEKEEEILGIV